MVQLGGILCRHHGPLLYTGLPLMKNIFKPLATNIIIGLTAATAATDAPIQKKIYESGEKSLIVSNEEMDDIMKIVNSLEEWY